MADSAEHVEVVAEIAAPPEVVYDLVTDIARMGEWSPENRGGRWVGDLQRAEVGARFVGRNAKDVRRWSTHCLVTTARRGERFAFHVTFSGIDIADWSYDFAATPTGTRVVETFDDRRPVWMRHVSVPVMGVRDRAAYNREGMQRTLAALKRAAENG